MGAQVNTVCPYFLLSLSNPPAMGSVLIKKNEWAPWTLQHKPGIFDGMLKSKQESRLWESDGAVPTSGRRRGQSLLGVSAHRNGKKLRATAKRCLLALRGIMTILNGLMRPV